MIFDITDGKLKIVNSGRIPMMDIDLELAEKTYNLHYFADHTLIYKID